MKHIHKLAIIGGTGKSGKYLVKQLLQEEIPFKLLLRNPENFQISSPLVEIVQGDARDYESVLTLIRGCEAIISTLGQPKGEPSIFSQATQNVLDAMHELNIHRYIVTTGLNVDTPSDEKSPPIKYATDWMKTNYTSITSDKQVEYELLANSHVDWTFVRLPLIEQSDACSEISISTKDCPGDKISAANLAHFLIKQLESSSYSRSAPFIADKG